MKGNNGQARSGRRRGTAALLLAGAVVLTAALAARPARAQDTIVRCDPAVVRAQTGQIATTYLYVQDIAGLNGVNLWLTFNTGIGTVVDLDGDLPGVQVKPLSEFLSADWIVYQSADNTLGEIHYAVIQLTKPERTGSGRLAMVQFAALESGTITLQFSKKHDLADGSGRPIAHTVQECQIIFAVPTAVELASFSAASLPGAIELRWETVGEADILGFDLFRAASPQGEPQRLNGALIPHRPPDDLGGAPYWFVDRPVRPGLAYSYWLDLMDANGAATRYGPVSAVAGPFRCHLPVLAK